MRVREKINIRKGILSKDNNVPNPMMLRANVIKMALIIFLRFDKKITNRDNIRNFCRYEPAIASCSKKPLNLPENGWKPNMSYPVKCWIKISRDSRIDDINEMIDNFFIFTIWLKNKFLITQNNKKNLKLNIDLINISYPKEEILFNVLITFIRKKIKIK